MHWYMMPATNTRRCGERPAAPNTVPRYCAYPACPRICEPATPEVEEEEEEEEEQQQQQLARVQYKM